MSTFERRSKWNGATASLAPKEMQMMVRCGSGQVVSVLALFSNDPSPNPVEDYFSVKNMAEKNKNKESGVGLFKTQM